MRIINNIHINVKFLFMKALDDPDTPDMTLLDNLIKRTCDYMFLCRFNLPHTEREVLCPI